MSSFERSTIVIVPSAQKPLLELGELWAYRHLITIFLWRDITVRYKQSIIGIGWAIIQPIILMIVFSILFGRLAGLPSDGNPYPIFTFSALLPWLYFSRSVVSATGSLVNSASLLTKVYFPRLLLPLSKVFVGLVDFGIAMVILGLMMLWYGVDLHFGIVCLPLFLALALLTALGIGFWLSALNVKYRDIGLGVPYLVQVWLFASPVAYSSSLIPDSWRWLYGLNPMAGVIEGFRWALLGKPTPDTSTLIAGSVVAGLLLVSGYLFFHNAERNFADVI